jgi:LPXTG-motif cell wall-anchored protein
MSYRILAASAAAALVLLASPMPATAAAVAGVGITLRVPQVTLPVGEDRQEITLMGRLLPPADGGAERVVDHIDVTVDLSGAADVVDLPDGTISFPPRVVDCTTVALLIRCTVPGPLRVTDTDWRIFEFWYRARAGAVAGAAGTMRVTAQADDGPVFEATSGIRLGEPVDLAPGYTSVDVPPGGTAGGRPRVAISGTRAVDGSIMIIWIRPELVAARNFSNCRYGARIICTFDTVMSPGFTYALAQDLTFTVPADAALGSRSFSRLAWLTPAQWEDRQIDEPEELGVPGTGAPVGLVAVPSPAAAAAARVPQADETPWNDRGVVDVRVGGQDSDTDIALIGGTVRGAIGADLPLSVGVVNNGPGTMYSDLFILITTPVEVYLPEGVTVVRADPRCTPLNGGPRSFTCRGDPPVWRPGPAVMFDFTVRFQRGFTGEDGGMSIQEGGELPINEADGTWGNNYARIVTTVVAAPGDGGSGGGGSGDGGTLPITGANVGLIAAGGVLLISVGVAGVLVVRRRRVHFTA